MRLLAEAGTMMIGVARHVGSAAAIDLAGATTAGALLRFLPASAAGATVSCWLGRLVSEVFEDFVAKVLRGLGEVRRVF